MDIKKHIAALGFVPKNGTNGIYHKMYLDYAIEIDFEKQSINYGSAITADSKTTQNFSDAENFRKNGNDAVRFLAFSLL